MDVQYAKSGVLHQTPLRTEVVNARNGVDVLVRAEPVRYNIRCYVVVGGREIEIKRPCINAAEGNLDEEFSCIREHFQTHGVVISDEF